MSLFSELKHRKVFRMAALRAALTTVIFSKPRKASVNHSSQLNGLASHEKPIRDDRCSRAGVRRVQSVPEPFDRNGHRTFTSLQGSTNSEFSM